MRFRRLLITSLAMTLAMGVVAVRPAAAEVSGGTFQCNGVFWSWPGNDSAQCAGTAQGVFREGPTTVVCAPFCAFNMTIAYSTSCFLNEPPLIGAFAGTITIGGAFATPYSAVYASPEVAITTTSPIGAGEATLIPTLPLPTCSTPNQMGFQLAGSLAFD